MQKLYLDCDGVILDTVSKRIYEKLRELGITTAEATSMYFSKLDWDKYIDECGQIDNSIDKIKAIILIQVKVLKKYENLITIVLSQIWGTEERNTTCRRYVMDYIKTVEKIIKEGIEKQEIIDMDSEVLASEIFASTCTSLIYKMKTNQEIDIKKMYTELETSVIKGIKK